MAGMIGSGLQGFNSQEGMEFSNPFAGMFGGGNQPYQKPRKIATTPNQYAGNY
jgi:hypothetical protein